MTADAGRATMTLPTSNGSSVSVARKKTRGQEMVVAQIRAEQERRAALNAEKLAAENARKAAEAEKLQSKVAGKAKVAKGKGRNIVAPKNALLAVKSNLNEKKEVSAKAGASEALDWGDEWKAASSTPISDEPEPIKLPSKKNRPSSIPLPLPPPSTLPLFPTSTAEQSTPSSASSPAAPKSIRGTTSSCGSDSGSESDCSDEYSARFPGPGEVVTRINGIATKVFPTANQDPLSPVKKKTATNATVKKKKRIAVPSATGVSPSLFSFGRNPFVYPMSSAAATSVTDSNVSTPFGIFGGSTVPAATGSSPIGASGSGLAGIGMNGGVLGLGLGILSGQSAGVGGSGMGSGGMVGMRSPSAVSTAAGFGVAVAPSLYFGTGPGPSNGSSLYSSHGIGSGVPLFTSTPTSAAPLIKTSPLSTSPSATIPTIQFDFVGKSSPLKSPVTDGGLKGVQPLFQGNPTPKPPATTSTSRSDAIVSPWEVFVAGSDGDEGDYGKVPFTLKDLPDLLDDAEVEHMEKTLHVMGSKVDSTASSSTRILAAGPPQPVSQQQNPLAPMPSNRKKKGAPGKPPLHPNQQQNSIPMPSSQRPAHQTAQNNRPLTPRDPSPPPPPPHQKNTEKPPLSPGSQKRLSAIEGIPEPQVLSYRRRRSRYKELLRRNGAARGVDFACFFCEFENVFGGREVWRRRRDGERVESPGSAGSGGNSAALAAEKGVGGGKVPAVPTAAAGTNGQGSGSGSGSGSASTAATIAATASANAAASTPAGGGGGGGGGRKGKTKRK
ncbi:hypothetical protein HDU67_000891 [Dinochytrium kinnereticum]|nr:hypothetical protein HDU67_000891 [Dinochytrium kinnereticum]